MTWNGRKALAGLVAGCALNFPAIEAAGQGYVRVGIGAALAAETRFTDVDCDIARPGALNGGDVRGVGEPLYSAGGVRSGGGD